MRTLCRTLLVAIALLTSGVVQIAAAAGEDACCAHEGAGAPDCSPGATCECCPVRVARTSAQPEVAPADLVGAALSVLAAEPLVGPPSADIFHPPRA